MITRRQSIFARTLLAAAAASALVSAGCSTAKPAHQSQGPSSAVRVVSTPAADQLDRKGVLSLCTETGTPPAAFYDSAGKLTGYLPDLGNAIAARMGLPANWVDSVFDTIIIAANTGKCDVVIADQFITAARQKQIDMIPYGRVGQQFLATAGNAKKYGDPAGSPLTLCGLKVGTLLGGAEEDYLHTVSAKCQASGKPAVTISTTTTTPAGLQSLQGGLTQLFFTDSPVSGYYAKQQPGQFATVGAPINDVEVGISVPMKKTDLQSSVRAVLTAMQADGSYPRVFATWGQQAMVLPEPGKPYVGQ